MSALRPLTTMATVRQATPRIDACAAWTEDRHTAIDAIDVYIMVNNKA